MATQTYPARTISEKNYQLDDCGRSSATSMLLLQHGYIRAIHFYHHHLHHHSRLVTVSPDWLSLCGRCHRHNDFTVGQSLSRKTVRVSAAARVIKIYPREKMTLSSLLTQCSHFQWQRLPVTVTKDRLSFCGPSSHYHNECTVKTTLPSLLM